MDLYYRKEQPMNQPSRPGRNTRSGVYQPANRF
jgi:hypothetical protein